MAWWRSCRESERLSQSSSRNLPLIDRDDSADTYLARVDELHVHFGLSECAKHAFADPGVAPQANARDRQFRNLPVVLQLGVRPGEAP
jgi:hypothetical protein